MAPVLEMRQMTKRYGNLYANDGIDFSLEAGEIHAIVGENGAGKSTLMKILYGMETPTAGQILVRGQAVRFRNPADAIAHGIGMVHQHFMLFPPYTVAQNVVAGREPTRMGLVDKQRARAIVQELSRQYHMDVNPDQKISRSPVGIQQRTEILKVLYRGAEILILDEPTAVLTPMEAAELMMNMRVLADQGKSVVLITHKLNEVMAAADRVLVLRNGQVTGRARTQDTTIAELSKMMVGRDVLAVERGSPPTEQVVLDVQHLTIRRSSGRPVLDDVSFVVKSGEIVGVAGVSGNGQSDLIQVLTGLTRADQGTITVGHADVTNQSVQTVRRSGVAHIPEDRQHVGAAMQASVQENMILGHHRRPDLQSRGFLKQGKLARTVQAWVDRFQVKTPSLQQAIGGLSGGNVQKAIFGREVEHRTKLLIAAEPTRGVDISAIEFIHEALMERREEGGAILLVSSELSEILTLSDRVLVMFEGRIVGELPIDQANEENIGLLMVGGQNS